MRLTEYVNRYRIRIAKTMLRDPCLKVYEVAQRTGFQDVSYFCRVFKELEDITVTAYRRSLPAVLLPGGDNVAAH
jgi:YesN/AraC family two-component response regulator